MKTLIYLFIIVILFGFMASCEKTDLQPDEAITPELKSAHTNAVTMGLNIVFTGNYDFVGVDEVCGELPLLRVINNGSGTGTHFGHLTSHFDFCFDSTDGSYPAGHIEAWFEDDNGDMLYVEIAGFVIPGRLAGMPNFATSYFKDPFTITGGTGRFEGATGSGWSNDYNSSMDANSHHHWKGTITLVKQE